MIEAYEILETVREKKPLIHHLTNWVTIYDCANVTRTIGALPVMAHAPEEVSQMTGIASALVLNIGTLTKDFVDSMIIAGKAANKKGIPIVLDAVGAGATDLRTEEAKRLLSELKIDILKGNAGEIAVLAGVEAEVKGVESISVDGDPVEIAKGLAKTAGATVVITGKEDISTDGENTYIIKNGHELMGAVVGTGCMAASVIGSFAAVEKDYAKAAAAALACFGIGGEIAAQSAKGPGTFKEAFFDALYNLSADDVNSKLRVE
jgi:hydroxyethylthiazole kinase